MPLVHGFFGQYKTTELYRFRKSVSWTLINSDIEYAEVAIGLVLGKYEIASDKG
jgi:hypothetical protein